MWLDYIKSWPRLMAESDPKNAKIGVNVDWGCTVHKQENRWKRGMLPKSLLSIKGRRCNQTLLVHQDMTKKTTFYEKN